jgi:hypothetical protein
VGEPWLEQCVRVNEREEERERERESFGNCKE